jgi:hypothetical protein
MGSPGGAPGWVPQVVPGLVPRNWSLEGGPLAGPLEVFNL